MTQSRRSVGVPPCCRRPCDAWSLQGPQEGPRPRFFSPFCLQVGKLSPPDWPLLQTGAVRPSVAYGCSRALGALHTSFDLVFSVHRRITILRRRLRKVRVTACGGLQSGSSCQSRPFRPDHTAPSGHYDFYNRLTKGVFVPSTDGDTEAQSERKHTSSLLCLEAGVGSLGSPCAWAGWAHAGRGGLWAGPAPRCSLRLQGICVQMSRAAARRQWEQRPLLLTPLSASRPANRTPPELPWGG